MKRAFAYILTAVFIVLCHTAGVVYSATHTGSFAIPLVETLGGTNQSSYATGDTLYASGSNTLSKRTIGSAGNVATVTAGAPDWSAATSVSGSFIYGDGSDGAVTFDAAATVLGMVPAGGTYTMTRDIYCSSITVNAGATIKEVGFRIFCTGTCSVSGQIQHNGNDGSGATAGAASAQGSFFGTGVVGGTGGTNATGGSPGTITTNGIGGNGGNGVAGQLSGGSGTAVTGPGASSGTPRSLLAYLHMEMPSSGNPTQSFKFGGGGGGGGATNGTGGGGGGGGGCCFIAAKTLTINSGGIISAVGGNGGNGSGTNAGGGGGGGGGAVVTIYNVLTNSGSITVAGGTKGTSTGVNSGGTNGSTGVIYTIKNGT